MKTQIQPLSTLLKQTRQKPAKGLSKRLGLAIAVSLVTAGTSFASGNEFPKHFDCVGAAYWAYISTQGEDGALTYVKAECKRIIGANYKPDLISSIYDDISGVSAGSVVRVKYGLDYSRRLEEISRHAISITRVKISEMERRDSETLHKKEDLPVR